ncbi:MAG: cupin domain-containing protein [Bacteroidales bacterium]|nr:cupin domain-containing protein [Bacteroidales bacterium]
MRKTAEYWINHLGLKQHPEGGYFREVYRAGEFIQKKGLPSRYSSFRSFSTSIYFLLKGHEFSAFHRIKSDETWHFYEGEALVIYIILPDGKLATVRLGQNPDKKEIFQFTIPKGAWFAAKPETTGTFSLVGCTVAPGFDFDDFELGEKKKLIKLFPQHKVLIGKFTII